MKKIIVTIICFIAIANAATAQYVNIPDSNFRNYLIVKYPACFNSAKQMDTTCNAIVNETAIDAENSNFSSISGIEYFDNLKQLNVSSNNITSITKLPENLISFICESNLLNALPPLPSNLKKLVCYSATRYGSQFNMPSLPSTLTYLNCTYCYLNNLPILPSSLDTLYCESANLTLLPQNLPLNLKALKCALNRINVLPSLPASLTDLSCWGNPLTTLPQLPSGLRYFGCGSPSLLNLPNLPDSLSILELDSCINFSVSAITLPSFLTELRCYNSNLTTLPNLPASLTFLEIKSNNLVSMPLSLPNLTDLICDNNHLYSIPFLPSSLKYFSCLNNNITSLPVLPAGLISLYCSGNKSLFCLPKLPSSILYIGLDTSYIKCLPNIKTFQTIYDKNYNIITMPICNAANNPNQCEAFPTVVGNMFYDNNSNGVKDANEPYKVFGLVFNSNTNYAFTNNNGSYAIGFDNTGTYNLAFTAPPFYNAVPPVATVTFNSYDSTIVLPDIALQPTITIDSLAIVATPILDKARPGWGFPYFVGYANVGTTTLSPNISLGYDNNYLIYDSCDNPLVTNSGSSLNLLYPNMPAGQLGYHVGYFRVKPTATLGDTIKATASITSATTNAVFDAPYSIITGAFDPNEKDATPTLTPTQVALGKPINYTIHFQNTGTDTAFNVVVADTLSTLLQTNTLQVISSSHSCKVSVKNGVAYFEFLNIKLPDSNVNELRSHGFVRFTIKPKTNLTAGVNIYNKAYIYFDYNAAIVTNTAVTQIKSAVVTPLKITSYELRIVNEKNVENIWTTANEINVSHFNIQRSINGKDFITIGKVKANNKNANEYSFIDNNVNNTTNYYRIVAVDNDGQLNYSTTKFIAFNTKLSSVKIYPNPATSIVNIESKDAKQITIIDYFGRTIYKSIINSERLIVDTKQFAKGIYIVQVVLQNGSIINEKLIVE